MTKLRQKEAVIALMSGKRIYNSGGMAGPIEFFWCDEIKRVKMIAMKRSSYGYSLDWVFERNDWYFLDETV